MTLARGKADNLFMSDTTFVNAAIQSVKNSSNSFISVLVFNEVDTCELFTLEFSTKGTMTEEDIDFFQQAVVTILDDVPNPNNELQVGIVLCDKDFRLGKKLALSAILAIEPQVEDILFVTLTDRSTWRNALNTEAGTL